jgi:hypothetical protein
MKRPNAIQSFLVLNGKVPLDLICKYAWPQNTTRASYDLPACADLYAVLKRSIWAFSSALSVLPALRCITCPRIDERS